MTFLRAVAILLAITGAAFGQCGPLALNPITGELNCTGPAPPAGSEVTTAVALTADLPVIGAGATGIAIGTKTGTGTTFATNTGPTITSPVFVTPALGTPASGVMTNVTGTAAGLTAGAATALAANPADCAANQFANAIAASGALTCGAIADADVPDTITASSYLPLAGGTLTGALTLDNLGIIGEASDTNPTCSGAIYGIYADLSETKWKKCTNGVASDLDTGGTPDFSTLIPTSPDSSITIGNTGTAAPTLAINFSGLNTVYPTLAGPNSFTAGGKNTFPASATTAGFNITGTADPSAPAAGDYWTNLAGILRGYDGAAVREYATLDSTQTLTNKSISGGQITSAVTTATTANAGDSATSFFPSGTIEDARLPASMDSKTFTTYLIAPQGTGPTIDAAGKIGVDTTTDQFKFYGGAARALPSIYYMSFVIPAPATTDDINLVKASYGMTILGIDAIVQGTTSATGQMQECASDGTSCVDLDSDIVADADGAADDGTLSDPTIASGAWLRWKTTSVSGTPTFLTVTVRYRVIPD